MLYEHFNLNAGERFPTPTAHAPKLVLKQLNATEKSSVFDFVLYHIKNWFSFLNKH